MTSASLFEQVERKHHYSGMLADSGRLKELQQHSFEKFMFFRDPGYPQNIYLQSGFEDANITQDELI